MNILGREIPDDDIRTIAGARCWVVDGMVTKATREFPQESFKDGDQIVTHNKVIGGKYHQGETFLVLRWRATR